MTKEEFEESQRPFQIVYAKDLSKPPDVSPVEMRGFNYRLAMCWFVLTNPEAKAAYDADRMRFLRVERSELKKKT